MISNILNSTIRITLFMLCFFLSLQTKAEITSGIDESAQLSFWELNSGNVKLRLVQRLPDQTRGFFEARGFKKDNAELIAQNCVFQTIFKNSASEESNIIVDYDISQWIVIQKTKSSRMGLREEWDKTWQQRNVPKSSRIAFEWALIPTKQRYQAQDYNWGMTLYGLPPGSKFNLQLNWSENGSVNSATINNIECAPDIHPDPGSPFKK